MWTRDQLLKINSMTKYPSIPTYHEMGHRGILKEDNPVKFEGKVYIYEKIDGTNSRIIFLNNREKADCRYAIGSKEELVYFSTDVLWDKSLNIVGIVKSLAERLRCITDSPVFVIYLESYGGRIGKASKQYTGSKKESFAAFDIALFEEDWDKLKDKSFEQISGWRQRGGISFLSINNFRIKASTLGIKTAPCLGEIDASCLPVSIQDTYNWLRSIATDTKASLDSGGKGNAEGIVIRSTDRKTIAKIRFEDYHKTIAKYVLAD